MKRQAYIKPTITVVQLHHQCQILAGSVNNVRGNLGNDDFIWDNYSDEEAR